MDLGERMSVVTADNPLDARAGDARFPHQARLHHGGDYNRVFHHQQKAAGRLAVVLVRERPRKGQQLARIGVMVPAKVIKTAVRRHQVKRWVREWFRTEMKSVFDHHDVVVLMRADPPTENGHAILKSELAVLASKALAARAQPGQRGGRKPPARPGSGATFQDRAASGKASAGNGNPGEAGSPLSGEVPSAT